MPGNVLTPGADAIRQNFADAMGVSLTDTTAGIPLGRPGDPRDIAEAVAYLASDRAQWITGASLIVDGGELPSHLALAGPQRSSALTTPGDGTLLMPMMNVFMVARSRQSRFGWRSRTGLTPSSRAPRCRMVDSACQLDTNCTLIGMPSALVPNLIVRPGSPVMFKGTVEPCR